MRVELRSSVAVHGTRRVMFERCGDELCCRLRRMNVADTRLRIPLQFAESHTHAFAVRFAHSKVSADECCKRDGLRRGEGCIPACAMFCARDLFAVLVFVSFRRLMPDELRAVVRMLTLAQSCKAICLNKTLQFPLRSKLSTPFAVHLVITAPVILPLGDEFTRVVGLSLSCRERLRDGQHAFGTPAMSTAASRTALQDRLTQLS